MLSVTVDVVHVCCLKIAPKGYVGKVSKRPRVVLSMIKHIMNTIEKGKIAETGVVDKIETGSRNVRAK